MKRIFTLILCLTVLSASVWAQRSNTLTLPGGSLSKARKGMQAQHTPANKTTALNSRLIIAASDEWNGASWTNTDSSHFTYTGTRGGDAFSRFGSDYDEGIQYYWDAGAWETDVLMEKTYDAGNRMISATDKYWDGTAWVNNNRMDFTYTVSGRLASTAHQIWDGAVWVNDSMHVYTYDGNGNMLIDEISEGDSALWRPNTKITRTYNASNKILTELYEIDASGWLEQDRFTWEYDASGNIDTLLTEKFISGPDVWELRKRSYYTYNAANKPLTVTNERMIAGAWQGDSRFTYVYNGQGHETRETEEDYVAGAWENKHKVEQTVDGNGRPLEIIDYEWDGAAWENDLKGEYAYDAAGNETRYAFYDWLAATWEQVLERHSSYNQYNQVVSDTSFWQGLGTLEPEDRTYYIYEEYQDGGTGINSMPVLSSAVLPNPFTINVAIQLNLTEMGNYNFEVYNLTGQQVYADSRNFAPGQQTIIWNGENAPNGVYFYKISSPHGVASGKLVKQ